MSHEQHAAAVAAPWETAELVIFLVQGCMHVIVAACNEGASNNHGVQQGKSRSHVMGSRKCLTL